MPRIFYWISAAFAGIAVIVGLVALSYARAEDYSRTAATDFLMWTYIGAAATSAAAVPFWFAVARVLELLEMLVSSNVAIQERLRAVGSTERQ